MRRVLSLPESRLVWNAGDGSRTVEGGAGADVLELNGSAAADTVIVSPNGARVLLSGHAAGDFVLDIGAVERLDINAGAGDDTVVGINGLATLIALDIDGGAGNDTLTGADGADALAGGDGHDTVSGGRGADTGLLGSGDDHWVWNPGDGNDTVDGQGGIDTLLFNASNAGEQLVLTADGSHVRLTRDIGSVTSDLSGLENLHLLLRGGSDTVTVNSLAGTHAKRVHVDLGLAGIADGSVDVVHVAGGEAREVIRPSLQDGALVIAGLAAQTVIVHFDAADQVHLLGLGGNDSIDASALAAGGPLLPIDGGAGDDTLIGSANADLMFGGADRDRLTGGSGADQLHGNAGDDRFVWRAGDGNDVIEGGDDSDVLELNGGATADSLIVSPGSSGRVVVSGPAVGDFVLDVGSVELLDINTGAGDDTVIGFNGLGTLIALDIDGGAGNDTLTGGDGADRIAGGDGTDSVTGGRGADTLLLGYGNDRAVWNPGDGSDSIDGQGGADTLQFNASNAGEKLALSADGSRVLLTRDIATVTMDLQGIETVNLQALGGADTITLQRLSGTALRQVNVDLGLFSGTGDGAVDSIEVQGRLADNLVRPSLQNGALVVDGLDAVLAISHFEAIDRVLLLGGGADTIDMLRLAAGSTPMSFDAGAGNDTLRAGAGDDRLAGGEGDDRFVGNTGGGNDVLDGGNGDDRLELVGGNAADTLQVTPNGGRIFISGSTATLPFGIDAGSIESIALSGGAGDDAISALNGLSGLTTLDIDGGLGNDTLTGGDGNDRIAGGEGHDTVSGGRGADAVQLGNGNDRFAWSPGDGNDSVDGQGGIDTLLFNASNAGEQLLLTADGGHVRLTRDIGSVTSNLSGFENLLLLLRGGSDTVTLNSLAGTGTTRIDIDLGAMPGGAGDGAFDLVKLLGSTGDDHFQLWMQGGALVIDGLGAQVLIRGFDTGDELQLFGMGGNDIVDTSAVPPGGPVITLVGITEAGT
ncbi:hypothetical protein HLB44_02490 [Aquincola sp. S2]|uniref:Calcium-binding protein n=1 Tax=Pseudaquabacterium terrae TaxID=2732868 RepID=A0ABX2ECZ0_9BURK|nr:calcium-binding protein [Aquabacterium terrae]NRF65848.1 hypothetical protein [Aquabacterium terrae]